jgi:eukaryotic-like serine/threonine-protein kinase
MTTFLEQLQAALDPAYELGDELMGAGMSRVFLATDRALGRKVVVKVLPPDLAAGVNRDRFRREIQLAAHLQHPHIVPLLSAGESGDILYYTMPFIDGESLRVRLERKGRRSVREVMRILHDVLDALAYAHARGVIHRDIKPGNILTQGHHALVTDFGVAKALSAALPATGMTSTGMAIGTPAYMAPEQLAADPTADHRVDIYAVGLLAYELLSGESPFTGPSPAATMAAQLTRDPPPLAALRSDVPPALSSLVNRCLAKAPEDRPSSAELLLAELDELPIPSGPTTPTQATTARPTTRAGRPNARLAGVGGLLAVAIGVAVALGRGKDGRATPEPAAAFAATDTMPASAAAATTPAPAQPRALTRDDSLAIANAVRAELARAASKPASAVAGKRVAGVAEAEGAAQLTRAMVDSVVRASISEWSRPTAQRWTAEGVPTPLPQPGRVVERAPKVGAPPAAPVQPVQPAGPRRIVITEPRQTGSRPELAEVGRSVSQSMGSRLRRDPSYRVVSRDSVLRVLERTREVGEVASALNADVVASVGLIPIPGDSLVVLIRIRDRTAAAPYTYRVASSGTIPISSAPAVVDSMAQSAVSLIDEMTRAPRRDEVARMYRYVPDAEAKEKAPPR